MTVSNGSAYPRSRAQTQACPEQAIRLKGLRETRIGLLSTVHHNSGQVQCPWIRNHSRATSYLYVVHLPTGQLQSFSGMQATVKCHAAKTRPELLLPSNIEGHEEGQTSQRDCACVRRGRQRYVQLASAKSDGLGRWKRKWAESKKLTHSSG